MRFRIRINSGLRARLFQLVFVALLPALGLIIYHAGEQRQKAVRDAENQALRAARLVAANQRSLIDSSGHLLVALSELPEVRNGDAQACGALFARLLDKYRIYANLAVANPDGDVVCSGRPTPMAVNIADRSYFQETVQQKALAIGNYQIGRISGKASVSLGYPVFDRDQQLSAVVILSVDLAWLNQSAKIASLPPGSVVTLSDRNATILSRYPVSEGFVGKSFRDAEIFKIALARGEGVAEALGADGKQRLYGFSTIGSSSRQGQIFLHVGIPKEIALADANWFLKRNLAAFLAVGALALLAVWYLGDALLVRELKSLAKTTARIGAGDFSARTGLGRRKNEVDRFAASLDTMATLLERRDNEAESAKKRVQRQLERIEALREIDMAISSTLDLGAMLKVLLEKIDLVLPAGVATIRLFNQQTRELEAVACRNLDEDAWRAENPRVVHDFEKTVLENRIPLTIANVQTDGRAAGLSAFYTRAEHAFDDDEIDFLTALAGLSAVASHNGRLFEEIRRRESEALAMHAFTAAACQSLDLSVTLKEAVARISENFHFDASRIFLFNREMTKLELKAGCESRPQTAVEETNWRRDEVFIDQVAASGEPIIFGDALTVARYPELSSSQAAEESGSRFVAMLPLKTKLITWGVAVFAGAETRRLTEVENRLLTSMSQQIAIAVENANLYEQTAAKAKELSALYSFAGLAGQSLDMNVLLRETTVKILEIFHFDAARVYWRQDDSDDVELVTHIGFPEEFVPVARYRMGHGRVGRAMESGAAMFVEDMASDQAYQRTAQSKSMLKLGFRSSFLIPIRAGGECVGVMNFLGKQPRAFSQSDIRLIHALAYHLGVAVGNAKLFSQVRRKTIELEEANKAKDEFLGVVSHELRTPLNVIKGYAEVLHGKMFGELNSQQESALDKIKNQSINLLHMINDVLRATTIDAQTVRVTPVDIDLGALLIELRDSYRFADASDREITWQFRDDLAVLRTDEEKLRAVLQNLINNAIKFTECGVIAISARCLPGNDAVEISVADTGIGIPADKIGAIFGMFQQIDGSVTRGYGGVGLGLYIVKNYLDLMGGRIEVTSELGKGTTFLITLPLDAVAHPLPEYAEAVVRGNGRTHSTPQIASLNSL
ncbi:MAG: putative Histidine kinase [Deltaproteobacteria bacterium]|nr:putative Histidine kinase [Deltaproteobacteria bacterium]